MVDTFKSKNSDVQQNLESVSNPINAFRMIKRLSETWKGLQDKMRADKVNDFLTNVSYAGRPHFPEEVGCCCLCLFSPCRRPSCRRISTAPPLACCGYRTRTAWTPRTSPTASSVIARRVER